MYIAWPAIYVNEKISLFLKTSSKKRAILKS